MLRFVLISQSEGKLFSLPVAREKFNLENAGTLLRGNGIFTANIYSGSVKGGSFYYTFISTRVLVERRWIHNAIRDRVIYRVKRVNRQREIFKEIKLANWTIQIDISTVQYLTEAFWSTNQIRPISCISPLFDIIEQYNMISSPRE